MSLGEVFTGLGFAVGGLVLYLAARGKRLATNGIGVVVAAGFLGGILGAKLTQLVMSGWPVSVPVEAALDPRIGGRALLGGLIFGWISVEIAKQRLGIRRSTGDLFALAIPAGEAVGRIGCYLNGCCYGRTCDLPWAVHQHGELRHPAQLYSAVVAASLFLFLLWLRPKLSKEGDLWKTFLIGFSAARFVLEFYRYSEGGWFGLTYMQWFCLELLVVTAVMWLVRARRSAEVKEAI